MNMAEDEKKRPAPLVMERKSSVDSGSSMSSTGSSLKPPRTPRFAEATAVHSPIEGRSPFADPPGPKTQSARPQAQPSDIGFGYISDNRRSEVVEMPMTPTSPLKSAMKVPGTARRIDNPLSPTFREEQILEKQEKQTEKQQAKDLVTRNLLHCYWMFC